MVKYIRGVVIVWGKASSIPASSLRSKIVGPSNSRGGRHKIFIYIYMSGHPPPLLSATSSTLEVLSLEVTPTINMKLMLKKPADVDGKVWPAIAIGLFVAFGGILFG